MKFAIVNGVRKEAEPKEIGKCSFCGNEVRAYCGLERINHWKHKSLNKCDHWNEGETEWHRAWKNHFDESQQEMIMYNQITGEKHVADIYLPSKDLIIEFQNSSIPILEIVSRESFYRKMIWVVNVFPYRENINFYKNIKYAFYDVIVKPWARDSDSKFNKFKKEGRFDEAVQLFYDRTGANYIDSFEKEFYPYSEKDGYYLMEWKYQHKRWNETRMPLFFDIGDGFVYRCVESIKIWNGFIVKRYSKESFIKHYRE